MSTLSKLIKVWAIGKALSAKTIDFHALLTRLAAIVMLAVMLAVLIAASIAGLLCFAYTQLVMAGYDRVASFGIIAGIMLVILLTLLIAIKVIWGKFRKFSRFLSSEYAPLPIRVTRVAHAFIEGLLGNRRN